MSLRLEMLQIARLAPKVLGDSSELVQQFILSRLNQDSGFQDRQGNSDLYYSVFGVEALMALRTPLPEVALRKFIKPYQTGESLDFVSLTSLIRCRAYLNRIWQSPDELTQVCALLESHRSNDGGFNVTPKATQGTLYGCFLALGAYQDLGIELPNPEAVINCVNTLRSQDGGFSNLPDQAIGTTPATAAAVAVLRSLDRPVPSGTGEWLLNQCHTEGGFFAFPKAPMPDLLSTATSLHALERLKIDISPIKEICLDFVDSLWCNQGAFYGHWADDMLDCEYTYYGLLSLGHLSL